MALMVPKNPELPNDERGIGEDLRFSPAQLFFLTSHLCLERGSLVDGF
ncbi:MAG: hypothetical protein CM15mP78_10120 [Candidatus Poseidoniales archaeon]|nr:MAG: hypothetical protein CM15mP78_10120 [Candidatus Poseidoniales archaeon]